MPLRPMGSGRPGAGPRPGAFAPPAALVLLVLLATVACGDAVPAEWTLDLEQLLVVGGAGAPEEAAFFRPTAIRVDGGGRLHVLDSGNDRVQVFDAQGAFVRSLGGSGQGPGELSGPEGLWVFPDGEVVVADTGNARLTRFGPSGGLLPGIPLDFLPLDIVGRPSRLWVLRLPSPALVAGSDPSPLVRGYGRDGLPAGEALPPAHADIGLLYFLQNTLRIAPAADGGFAVADTHVRSRIRLHDREGRATRTIPVLYKAGAWAPTGRLPAELDEASLTRVARTATDLAWDPRRGLYWHLAGYVDRDPDGSWVTARELYRYGEDGSYRGSVVLPFSAVRVAPSADGSIWLLDREGAVRRMRLTDPEAPTASGAPTGGS